jgi:hypothetical protein
LMQLAVHLPLFSGEVAYIAGGSCASEANHNLPLV